MHAVIVYLKPDHPAMPYLVRNMAGTRAVRNSANFLIRNTYTALGKPEEERTDNEKAVLEKVERYLAVANEHKLASHEKKLSGGKESVYRPFRFPDAGHRMLSYEQIDAVMKYSEDEAYYSCTSQVNQQAIRKTVSSWRSFYGSLSSWRKDKTCFQGAPRIPGYIRTKTATAAFTSQVSRLRTETSPDGRTKSILYLSNYGDIDLGSIPVEGRYLKMEATPSGARVRLALIFEDERVIPEAPSDPKRIMAVDPGVDNLAVCTANTGMTPLIVDGRYLKSINRIYNKEKAALQSIMAAGKDPHELTVPRTSKRIQAMSAKREDRIRDYFCKTAHCICRTAQSEGIEVIVFGHNKGQKQMVNIGHVNNQTFTQIPFVRFSAILKCVAAKYGIAVVETEESYTSKADLLMMDEMPVYGEAGAEPVFSGKRIKRGLYKSGCGAVINADVNGSGNILRKYRPDAFEGQDLSYMQSVKKIGYRDLYPVKTTA